MSRTIMTFSTSSWLAIATSASECCPGMSTPLISLENVKTYLKDIVQHIVDRAMWLMVEHKPIDIDRIATLHFGDSRESGPSQVLSPYP